MGDATAIFSIHDKKDYEIHEPHAKKPAVLQDSGAEKDRITR